MSSLTPQTSSATVRNILTLLVSRDAQLVAGMGGLERRVTWACRMRTRLPAFESILGGELAMLTLAKLRRLDETLARLLKSLHKAGVAAVIVAAQSKEELGEEALAIADQLNVPLILLPPNAFLEEIEREMITFVVNFRGEIERKATEISHQLVQLSVQGMGIKGVCDYLATNRGKWVTVQSANQQLRFQSAPSEEHTLLLPSPLTDDFLRLQGLTRVVEPILIRHEIVGYLSLIGREGDFDYLERIILGQVAPVLALEFARERERNEVESRYQVEAFTDVLQGNYQNADEMVARARILGYDLSIPQIVVVFETSSTENDDLYTTSTSQWSKRIREELLRVWPACWLLSETRRIIALLPVLSPDTVESEHENEQMIFSRLERIHTRMLQNRVGTTSLYSCGIGRVAKELLAIPQSLREAQQALEVGRRLFGEGKLHSFVRLGIYRLLFHLDGQNELEEFYQEILGPLIEHDTRNNGMLIETLEGFFRCNGNLSETARIMHLHRNSLLYRLDRISDILGRSLDDSELRLSLQIALKIRHLQKH